MSPRTITVEGVVYDLSSPADLALAQAALDTIFPLVRVRVEVARTRLLEARRRVTEAQETGFVPISAEVELEAADRAMDDATLDEEVVDDLLWRVAAALP